MKKETMALEKRIEKLTKKIEAWEKVIGTWNKHMQQLTVGVQEEQPPVQLYETRILSVGNDLRKTARELDVLEKQGFILQKLQRERDAFWQSDQLVLRRILFLRQARPKAPGAGGGSA